MKTGSTLILLLVSTLWLTGCPSRLTGDSYSRGEARTAQQVVFGTVEYVRPVQIEGTKTPVGALAGGAVGGLAGSTVGSGTTSSIAAVVGGLAGGLLGGAAEEQVTKKQGVEVTVRLDSGKTIAVVQEADPNVVFYVGQRVRLLSHGGTTRVTP